MIHCCRYRRYTVFAFLTLCASFANLCIAQSNSRVSAFTTCVDSAGNFSLCSLHSWDLASGYSANEQGQAASLFKGSFDPEAKEQECSQATKPSSLEIRLSNPDLSVGDRIYLDDFIIEAFDDNGNLIPEVPILVYVLSQDGMLETDSNWDYVEIFSYGHADFFAEYYCRESPGMPGVSSSFTLIVTL